MGLMLGLFGAGSLLMLGLSVTTWRQLQRAAA